MTWVFEKAVKPPSLVPPTEGRLYWGKNVKSDEIDHENDVDTSTGAQTVETCIEFARFLLTHTNTIVKQDRADPKWSGKTHSRYTNGRMIREQLLGNPSAQLESAFWSFDNTASDNALGASCEINWTSKGTTTVDKQSVSGAVTRVTDGRRMQCVYPRYSNECMEVKSSGSRKNTDNLCTGLSLDNALGDDCRAWYDTLPPLFGTINQSSVVSSICSDTLWNLEECVCINRVLDPLFVNARQTSVGASADECWWLPCKQDDPGMRVLPAMIEGRHVCPTTFCGNVVNLVDANGNAILDQLNQNVSCTTNQNTNTDGSTDVNTTTGDGDTVSSVLDEKPESPVIDQTTTYILYVVVALILLVFVAGIYAYSKST